MNRISIDADEIIDYVIDGVPDPRLWDHARLQRFKEATKLIKAFEKIILKGSLRPERSATGNCPQKIKKETKSATSECTKCGETKPAQKVIMKYYNYKEKGYRAADCSKPRLTSSKSIDKRFSEGEKSSGTSGETNLIQLFIRIELNTISIFYSVSDIEGNTHDNSPTTIIDTESPISLIKPEYAPINCRAPIKGNNYRFNEINNSKIEMILGIFERIIKVNDIEIYVKFFVIPHKIMNVIALLGRDFTSNPVVKLIIDQVCEINAIEMILSIN